MKTTKGVVELLRNYGIRRAWDIWTATHGWLFGRYGWANQGVV